MNGHYPDCLAPTDCWCEVRRYGRVLRVAVLVLAIQAMGAYIAGSLALWADTVHVLLDNAAILVTIFVAALVKFGTHGPRTRTAGFWVNVALLAFLVLVILTEAYGRLDNPTAVTSWIMMIIAAVGLVGNWRQHQILEEVDHEYQHAMHRSLSAHVLSDLAVSAGVIVAGILILAFDAPVFDPIASLAIGFWIAYRILVLIRDEYMEKGGASTHKH